MLLTTAVRHGAAAITLAAAFTFVPATAGAQPYVQVAVGDSHTCALRQDGTAECWGDDAFGQSTVPEGEVFVQLACGGAFSCGLREDGSVLCWGEGGFAAPSGRDADLRPGPYSAIAAAGESYGGLGGNGDLVVEQRRQKVPGAVGIAVGPRHGCAVREDGAVLCWGYRADGQADVPEGEYQQVAVGSAHSCGLRSDGSIVCWGDDGLGQQSAPGGTFTALAAAGARTCALQPDGVVGCWGPPWPGEGPDGAFAAIALGPEHGCGLREDGTLSCWGDDRWGQRTGRSTAITAEEREQWTAWREGRIAAIQQAGGGQGEYLQVSAGEYHACALRRDGEIVCWGRNAHGETTPPPGPFEDVAAYRSLTCGLRPDHQLECWPVPGEEWDGWRDGVPSDRHVSLLLTYDPCARREDGSLECFHPRTPTVRLEPDVLALDRPTGHCRLTADGALGCAPGSHRHGFSSAGLVAASFGGKETCGLSPEGEIRCWDRRGEPRTTPDGRFVQLQAAPNQTCAVRDDGVLRCWLGVPATTRNPTGLVEREVPEGRFTQVSCGGNSCCAVTDRGGIECWGHDEFGQADPVDGSFTGERREAWQQAVVESFRREETRGSWRYDVSGDFSARARKHHLLQLFEQEPELAVSMTARGTIGANGQVVALTWDPEPAEAPSLRFGLERDWRFSRGQEPIPFACTWNLEADSPTYEFGCRIDFVTGTYEFEDTMTWENPGWP